MEAAEEEEMAAEEVSPQGLAHQQVALRIIMEMGTHQAARLDPMPAAEVAAAREAVAAGQAVRARIAAIAARAAEVA